MPDPFLLAEYWRRWRRCHLSVLSLTMLAYLCLHMAVRSADRAESPHLSLVSGLRSMVSRTSHFCQPDNSSHSCRWKTVLMYNPFFNLPAYGVGLEDSGFHKYNCVERNCLLTADRADFAYADVVVFHGFLLGGTVIPRRAHTDQIYVFVLMESPLMANRYNWMSGLKDLFNLTITYYDHPDTDIVVPSGSIVQADKPEPIPTIKDIKAKTKLAFWIESNCRPMSSRQQYVQQLSKYIKIDTYGKCGVATCPKGDWTCFQKYSKDYFFNLAFENSYCTDYISEKTYRALQQPVVPVVLGGGNYSHLLPNQSYIDVRDFSSPRALAEYLVYLSEHPQKYQQYLTWKRHHSAMDGQYARGKAFCRLCQILHDPYYAYKSHFNPKSYWEPSKVCLSGESEKRALHLSQTIGE